MLNEKQENGAQSRRHRWLEPSIAILSLLITGLLWQFLRVSEQAHIRRMTGLMAEAVRADLDADLKARLSLQKQMARPFETEEVPNKVELESHAKLFIDHDPGCFAVDYIDPSQSVHRLAQGFGAEPNPAAGVPARLRDAMEHAVGSKSATMVVLPGEGAKQLFINLLPLYRGTQFRGLLMSSCDLKESFDDMLDDTKDLGYYVKISLGDTGSYHMPAEVPAVSEWGQAMELDRPLIKLGVQVWPKPALLNDLNSHVPESALFVGVLLSILLVMSVHYAQAARVESTRVDLVNRKLSSEVSERRLTEAALKASQARLAGILDISADAVVSVDENHRITLFNQGAEKIFGYGSEEVLGEPLDMLLPPQVKGKHRHDVEAFGAGSQSTISMSQRGTITGVRKDGTAFPADATISKLELPEGKLYTAILRDVTDRVRTERELRQAREELELRIQERTAELAESNAALQAEIAVRSETEKSLRQSEGRLQAILDNSAAAIFMKDASGRYILVNRFFEKLCQLPKEKIIGRTAREIFMPERAETLRTHDKQVLETCAPIEFEEVLEHDGEEHTYLAIKFPICDADGNPLALCGISTDITKRKQAEESLRELSAHLLRLQDEERRRIARELHDSAGSHLFALSIHLAKAQGLCREEDTEMRKALESGLQSVEHFSTEIRTLSYLLHPPLLDELGLVPALNSYVSGFAERSGIRAKFVSQPDLGRLPRPTELTIFRIVQEALTNIHHHSGSPSASIAIARCAEGVVVTISDEGRGFPSEQLARDGKGGVGLRGMRERVRQLGGSLEIQSGDHGTLIRATLPDSTSLRASVGQS